MNGAPKGESDCRPRQRGNRVNINENAPLIGGVTYRAAPHARATMRADDVQNVSHN